MRRSFHEWHRSEDLAHHEMIESSKFPRRALVCVLGLHPQVLTETLYALLRGDGPVWQPTEIHIVTTSSGAAGVRELLRNGGPFAQLIEACGLRSGQIRFDDSARHLHVIERGGAPLADIESPEDSTATGNAILKVVAPLAADEQCAIHASIAGGRKTMGALLASMMSLLGRPQDRMSHVLVNSALEGNRGFFFPPTTPQDLVTSDGRMISTDAAGLRLAEIPFLTFAGGMRSSILNEGTSYEQLVERANADLLPKRVTVAVAAFTIEVGDLRASLEPMEMAWYAHLAIRRRDRAFEPGLVAPGMVYVDKNPARNIGIEEHSLRSIFSRLSGLSFKAPPQEPSLFKEEFAWRVSTINKRLRDELGEPIAQALTVVGPGARGKRDGQYGLLNIDPERLHVV
jgi:CRISPR-associated protein (TIGR02584 family)